MDGQKKDLPPELREYWNFRDELSIENGIIKGCQVLIPPPSHRAILKQLHASHQGISKTQLLARESVFWIGINKDICKLCESYSSCQEFFPKNKKEPLMMHKKPSQPWIKIGTDLFSIDAKVFLIISDYFSRYPIVKELNDAKASTVVKCIKKVLGMFGTVREIVSYNGPCYRKAY